MKVNNVGYYAYRSPVSHTRVGQESLPPVLASVFGKKKKHLPCRRTRIIVYPYQRCSSQTINEKQYFLSLGVEFYCTWEGYRRVWLQGKNRLVSIFRLARFLDYETTECHKIIKSP